jgi:hypothetical protein
MKAIYKLLKKVHKIFLYKEVLVSYHLGTPILKEVQKVSLLLTELWDKDNTYQLMKLQFLMQMYSSFETIPTSYIIIGNVLNLVILLYQVVNQWYLDLT